MNLIEQAVNTLHEIRRLESCRKLCAQSFVDESLQVAGKTAAEVVEIEAKLAGAADAAHINAFVRTLVRQFRSPQHSRPFPSSKLTRCLHCYGSEECGRQLARHNVSVGECQAIAAQRAALVHPESFGSIQSFAEHEQTLAALREELANLLEGIRQQLPSSELLYEPLPEKPLPELHHYDPSDPTFRDRLRERSVEIARRERLARERGQGPWLRLAPHISLGQPDWPMQLIEYRLALQTGAADSPVTIPPDEPAKKPATKKAKPRRKKRKRAKSTPVGRSGAAPRAW